MGELFDDVAVGNEAAGAAPAEQLLELYPPCPARGLRVPPRPMSGREPGRGPDLGGFLRRRRCGGVRRGNRSPPGGLSSWPASASSTTGAGRSWSNVTFTP